MICNFENLYKEFGYGDIIKIEVFKHVYTNYFNWQLWGYLADGGMRDMGTFSGYATNFDWLVEGAYYPVGCTENSPSIVLVRKALAEMGIMSLYGGRKGHGFWIYKTSIEHARRMAGEFDPRKYAAFEGKVIMNDGVKSGNACFWMFEDIVNLILSRQDGVTTKGYEIQWNEFWNKWQVSHPEIGATLAEFDFLNFLGALEYCHKG